MNNNFNKLVFLFLCTFIAHQSIGQTCGSAASYDVLNPVATTYSIAGADAGGNSGSCGLDGDNAVWVSISISPFAVATEMTITMDDNWGGCGVFCTTDLTGALYSGSCGSLTTIDDCIDMSGGITNSNNGPWTFPITAGTDYFFRLSEEDDQPGFADLTFELDDTTLPLELASFEGKAEREGNLLQWTTVWEENVEWFIIEKSLDANSWEEYDRVEALGNSNVNHTYGFSDREPSTKTYYRLRIVDFDGYTEYSEVVFIQRDETLKPISLIYPNPTKGMFKVKLSENFINEKQSNVSVFNVLGELVLEGSISEGNMEEQEVELDLSQFPNGLYFVGIQGEGTSFQMEKIYKK